MRGVLDALRSVINGSINLDPELVSLHHCKWLQRVSVHGGVFVWRRATPSAQRKRHKSVQVPAPPHPPRSSFDAGTKVINSRNYNSLNEVEKLPVDVSLTEIWLNLPLVQSPERSVSRSPILYLHQGDRRENGKKKFFWGKKSSKISILSKMFHYSSLK